MINGSQSPAIPDYEKRLDASLTWALREGGMFFQNESEVQKSLRRITTRLEALGINYALVGGMALFLHGLRRFTEDVDILISPEGLTKVHAALEGSGYLPPFPNSKNLRDTENGVRIEFLVSGEFPGDGRVKPVMFPDPKSVSFDREAIKLLHLATLIELKLASGMTGAGRLKDLADVQELIKLLDLPLEYTDALNPYVHAKFGELWHSVHGTTDQEQQG